MKEDKISRRRFIKKAGLGALALSGLGGIIGCSKEEEAEGEPLTQAKEPKEAASPKVSLPGQGGKVDLTVAKGGSPGDIVRAAIDGLGGIDKFVKKGDTVALKPSVCWPYPVELAANTDPEVVRAIAELCYDAGAKKVMVLEGTGRSAQSAARSCGLDKVLEELNIPLLAFRDFDFKSVNVPQGKILKRTDIARQLLDADCFINIPIAKAHASTRLTLSMKNLMGLISDRQFFHARGIHQCIADLNTVIKPDLIIIDAVRISTVGSGRARKAAVKKLDTVIAGTNPVSCDSYATSLFNLKPTAITYIQKASEMGLGEMDVGKLSVKEIG